MLQDMDLPRRLPVWSLLSELFLDTETQEYTYRAIAEACRAAEYTRAEFWAILAGEVAPGFYQNLCGPIGEWAFWPPEFIQQRLQRVLRHGPQPPHRWPAHRTAYCAHHWHHLQPFLDRAGVTPAQPGDGTPSGEGPVVPQVRPAAHRSRIGAWIARASAPLIGFLLGERGRPQAGHVSPPSRSGVTE